MIEYRNLRIALLGAGAVGAQVASMTHYTGVGTGAEVSEYISAFAERTGADEVIVAHSSLHVAARLRSVELLATAHH